MHDYAFEWTIHCPQTTPSRLVQDFVLTCCLTVHTSLADVRRDLVDDLHEHPQLRGTDHGAEAALLHYLDTVVAPLFGRVNACCIACTNSDDGCYAYVTITRQATP